MKAFILNNATPYRYPADMEKILTYLNANGELNISPAEVEEHYRRYSEEKWCAGWMSVSYDILESFANYLAEINV